LTSVLELSLDYPIISIPMVKAFRKSVNILMPTGPSAVTTWDIVILLNFIRSMGINNDTLSLSQLQLKVTLLLRIDLLSRSSDLTKNFRSEMQWHKTFVKLRLLRPKEWRPEGKNTVKEWTNWIVVHKVDDKRCCLYRALKR